MKSFGQIFSANKGFGPGFDFVRIALAMSILTYHSVRVTGGYAAFMETPGWIIRSSLVPMFFAVSGFLITGSAMRLNLSEFLINRGLRIIPALATEILLSAFIVGLLFSQVPLHAYFTNSNFYQYFGNIVGYIQYDLPGVFLNNPHPGIVNASLWTIPYEYFCYFTMSMIIILKLLDRPRLVLALTIAALSIPLLWELVVGSHRYLPAFARLIMFGRGAGSFQCFMIGILFYLYRDRIPFHWAIAAGSAALVATVGILGHHQYAGAGWLSWVICAPLAYFILFIGLCRVPKLPFYSGGDYSYGVYLYAYPLQQSIVTMGSPGQAWWVNCLYAAPLATLVAYLSWHGIEKPILKLRKKFSFVGRRIAEGEGGKEAADLAIATAVARPEAA